MRSVERLGAALASGFVAAWIGCSGGSGEVEPVAGFTMLTGQTVLVLPVQYVRPVPGGWVGGAENAESAARRADREIEFALGERGGRAVWITPEQLVETLRRRPSIEVNPYALAADEVRRKGTRLRHVGDPLYGELRMMAALFDSRYALWPLEIVYEAGDSVTAGQLALLTVLLDARAGNVLWSGSVRGGSGAPSSAGALAGLAQAFAEYVSP